MKVFINDLVRQKEDRILELSIEPKKTKAKMKGKTKSMQVAPWCMVELLNDDLETLFGLVGLRPVCEKQL